MALFIYAGPMAFEYIHQNMPEALPSLRTVQNLVHGHYKTLDEGQFRFDELAQHLKQYKSPKIVSIGEDATRVIARIDYDNETDRCVGFVLPVDKNGLPITDSFLATSFDAIESMFAQATIAKYAYVYIAQPLFHNAPPFCLSCVGSDNTFTAHDVLLRWNYIISECKKRDIVVVSCGADGDPKLLKAMRVSASLVVDDDEPLKQVVPSMTSLNFPKLWYSWFHCLPKTTCFVQDTVHIAVKLKARLLKPSVTLAMGKYTATGRHLHLLKASVGKDQHGLREKDIDHKDRQNYDAVLHIVSAAHLLDEIKNANATKCYVELIGCVIHSYLDKSLDVTSHIEKAWYPVFFLRYWRQWILLHSYFTLKDNFVTSNAYMCVELNAHSLIAYLVTLRDHFPNDDACFVPWLLGSQCCERTFRAVRSMSSTFSTIINFGMLGLLRRLHRLQIQFSLESETDSGIIFPRVLKHQAKGGENSFKKYSLADVSNDKVVAAVEKAREAAKASIEQLGMADLLKKRSKWDSVPEVAHDIDDDDEDSDNDGNDPEDADEGKQDSDEVTSSVIQEVCSEEPVQVTADINEIAAKGLVEDEVKDRLELKQKLLSFKRIPSTTIPMYAPIENTKKKSEKSTKFSLFVEVKADNGNPIFIKKTTAVWLIQESERVSCDRFYRVRRNQPYTSKSKSFKKLKAIAIATNQSPKLQSSHSLQASSNMQSTAKTVAAEVDGKGHQMAETIPFKAQDYTEQGTPEQQTTVPEDLPTEDKELQACEDKEACEHSTSSPSTETILIESGDESEIPSQAWLKIGGITLYEIDKHSLLNNSSWMNGSVMTAVQFLLKCQFPHIHSLQDTLKQDLQKMTPMPTGLTSLQILLVNRNHWVVASASGNADSADVILYDSKYSLLHEHTKLLLSQLVFTKNKYFTVGIANVNKQSGDNDCGLFAAAYITSIAHGQDPSSIVYNQGLMREHLLTCLETNRINGPISDYQGEKSASIKDCENRSVLLL